MPFTDRIARISSNTGETLTKGGHGSQFDFDVIENKLITLKPPILKFSNMYL